MGYEPAGRNVLYYRYESALKSGTQALLTWIPDDTLGNEEHRRL